MAFKTKRVAERLNVDEDTAKSVCALINGVTNPEVYNSVQKWVRQCFNKPTRTELIMCAVDELLETCGVEAIRKEGRCDPYYGDCIASYCNNGDSYIPTVIRDHRREKFIIGCTGNIK